MTDKFPPWISPQISVGNILTIVALVLAGGMAWGTFRAEMAAQSNRLAVVERVTADREARLRAVEITQAGTAADVRSIQAGISRIENLLDQLAKARP